MSESADKPKPRRRWFRFSLRTLLVVMLLVGCALIPETMRTERSRRQKAAVEWVVKMDGEVMVGGYDNKQVVGVSLDCSEVTDIAPLEELDGLKWLRMSGTRVSDISPLEELTNLEGLWLDGTPVSDEQVRELQQALPDCEIHR